MNESTTPHQGSAIRPYMKRKKSSLGDTKVAVIGASGVGKTALSVRFLTKRFIGEYDQNSENKYKHSVLLDGESLVYEIFDTRSFNGDIELREDIIRWADGFLLVYSVTNRSSYEALQDARRNIEELKRIGCLPMILVANKRDMTHLRVITREEGLKLADDLSSPYYEVSASEDIAEVNEVFLSLGRDILDYKRRSRTFLDRVFGSRAKKQL